MFISEFPDDRIAIIHWLWVKEGRAVLCDDVFGTLKGFLPRNLKSASLFRVRAQAKVCITPLALVAVNCSSVPTFLTTVLPIYGLYLP